MNSARVQNIKEKGIYCSMLAHVGAEALAETVCGMDAAVEPTWTYSRRVSASASAPTCAVVEQNNFIADKLWVKVSLE